MSKKIAILGTAPSSRLLAPFNDPEWEIWACSPANKDLPHVDTWFEIHTTSAIDEVGGTDFKELLKSHPNVYVQFQTPEFPNAKEFPIESILQEFDRYYLTSSIAWMLCYAIQQKPEMIGIWGVDMSADEEYSYQRPGCRELVKEAESRGIKVFVPPQSDLLRYPPLYGYSENTQIGCKLKERLKELQSKVNQLQFESDQAKAKFDFLEKNKHYLNGAIADLNYIIKNWT